MDRSKITIEKVVEKSGVHPKIIDFACFNGYRLAPSDMTLDEQAQRIKRMNPEMDDDDVLVMLGDNLKDDIQEFFCQAFPVVGKNGVAAAS